MELLDVGKYDLYIVAACDEESIFQPLPVKIDVEIPDVIAPYFIQGFPEGVAGTNPGEIEISVQLNEPGKVYYVVLNDGEGYPTAVQVKSGVNSESSPVAKKGTINVNIAITKNIENPDMNVSYQAKKYDGKIIINGITRIAIRKPIAIPMLLNKDFQFIS